MITGVAIWPSAPILWFQQQGTISLGITEPVADLLAQCLDRMQSSLAEVGTYDRILIIGPSAPRPIDDPEIVTTPVRLATLPIPAGPAQIFASDPLADLNPNFSLPTWISGRLLRGFGCDCRIEAIEVGPTPPTGFAGIPIESGSAQRTADSVAAAAQLISQAPGRTLLVIVGDGAAAHGDRAPLARDDRSVEYDLSVRQALQSGSGAALDDALSVADLDRPLGLALGSVGYWPLRVLAAAGIGGVGRVHFDAAPLGVGYQVCTWIPDTDSLRTPQDTEAADSRR